MKKLRKIDYLLFSGLILSSLVFLFYVTSNNKNDVYHPVQMTADEIKSLTNNDTKAVFIYPSFTQIAYEKNGFYDYFNHKCSTCTTVPMNDLTLMNPTFNVGKIGVETLMQLHYPFITDYMVDKHPEILQDYDKIILLHNEYMTQKEFDAIKNHRNVVYLYPNAMYARVSVDYGSNTMTLVSGHNYPTKNIENGFGYVTTSQFEYDVNCGNYKWKDRPNGIGLTCYPEYLLTYDRNPMKTILDYPAIIPPLVSGNVTKGHIAIPFCDQNGNCTGDISK